MKTLKERLTDWQDFDVAAYELGVVLGLFSEFGAEPGKDPWNGFKWILWSNNPIGYRLYEIIHQMTAVGMLLEDEEGRRKWNPSFDASVSERLGPSLPS